MASDTSTLQFSRLQLARALKEDLNDENAPPAEASVIFLQTRNKRNNGLPDVKIPSHFHVPKPPNLIVPQPLAQAEAGQKQRQPPTSKPRAPRPQPLNTNARDSIAIFGDAPLLEGNNGPSTLLDARKTYIQTRHSHVQPLFSPVSSQRTSQLMHHRSSSTDSLKKNFTKPQTTSRLATVPPISVIRDDSSSISSGIQLPSPVTMGNYSPTLHPRERLSSSSQSSSGLVVTTPTDNYSPSRASRPSSRPPSRPQSVSNHMRVNSNGPNSPTVLQPSMSSRPSSLHNSNPRPASIYKYNPPPDSETEEDDQSSEKESSSSSGEEEDDEEEETKNTKGNNDNKPTKKGKESEYKLDLTLPKLELMLSSEEEASKEVAKVTRKSLTTLDKVVEEAPSHEEESSEESSEGSDDEEDDEEDEESSDDDTPLALKETAPPKINIEPAQSHKNRRLSAWLTDVSEKSILPPESPVKKESHGFLHPRKLSLSSFGLGSNGNDSSPRSRPSSRPPSIVGDKSPNRRLSVAIDQRNVGNPRRPQSMIFQEELLPPSPQFVVGSRRRSNSDHTTPRRSRPRSGIYPPMLDPVSISSTKESDFWAKDTLLALSDDYKSLGSLYNNHRSSTPTPKSELYIHSSGNRSSSSALNKALFKHNNQRDSDYNKTHRRDSSDEITLGELKQLRKGHRRDGSGESSGSGSPLASQATRSGDSLNNGFSSSSSGSPRTPVNGAGVGSYFPQQSRRRSSHDNAASHRGSVYMQPPSPRNRV